MVTCLHLSSEQLSHQEHYDFGMRALKAILTSAGDLKRLSPTSPEDTLILQALFSINLPKYTSSDIPLFLHISNDLFPNISIHENDYKELKEGLLKVCQEQGLSSETQFMLKCLQLYETLQTRHGLMLIGSAYSGKSTVISCLKQGLNSINRKVETYKINPKSISIQLLYGVLDPDTKSWEDGVLPIIMRNCVNSLENELKWVIFDGPVDSIWVENLNTVLDDNKKLCLTSGEIIKLNAYTSIIFEVDNLKYASPATISRCGMIYLETKILGWEALFNSFLWRMGDHLLAEFFEKTYKCLIQACFLYITVYEKMGVFFNDLAIVNTCLEIMEMLIVTEGVFNEEGFKNHMIFSLIWSFGASFDENSRGKFSNFLIDLIKGVDINNKYDLEVKYLENKPFNEEFSVGNVRLFDMIYDKEKKTWKSWASTLSDFSISKNIDYYELIIPNNDYIKNAYFLNMMAGNHKRFMLYGPTGKNIVNIINTLNSLISIGTGKTITFQNELKKNYTNIDYSTLTIYFSGNTTSLQVQKSIESKVNYRRRR